MKTLGCFKKIVIALIILSQVDSTGMAAPTDQDKRFKDIEIRVIRPKYFSKRGKFELGYQGAFITNQTFIYTFLGSGLMSYHFSEALGLEVAGSYGFSIDKTDKETLKDEFSINTIIIRTQYILGGSLLWTPIYGKFQMASGRLIYFDTFLSFGGGLTGVDFQYDHCATEAIDGVELPDPRSPQTISYPTFMGGIGQRFFLDKESSFRWDIRGAMFSYPSADGGCDEENLPEGTASQQNVTIQIGASKFF